MKAPVVILLLFFLLPFTFPSAQCITLDEAYARCQNISREHLETCLVNLIKDLQPLTIEGIPELDLNSGALEIHDLFFNDNYTNDNYIRATMTHGLVKGLQEMEIHELKLDYVNKVCTWKGYLPEYVYSGRYTLDAQFLFFPLKGNGSCWIRMSEIDLEGSTNFTVAEINGEKHVQATGSKCTYKYGNLAIRLNNLFAGDPILQEAGVIFINENKDDIAEEMRESIERSFGDIATRLVNNALIHIKFNDLAGHEYL